MRKHFDLKGMENCKNPLTALIGELETEVNSMALRHTGPIPESFFGVLYRRSFLDRHFFAMFATCAESRSLIC